MKYEGIPVTKEEAMTIEEHIASGGGICGTCAHPATATAENEGYSYCCNDRIEYDDEARDTVRRENCEHKRTKIERNTYFALDGTRSVAHDTVCADCGLWIESA